MSSESKYQTISFSFNTSSNTNIDYHPNNTEIKKFKADGSLSEKFKIKCKDFKDLMDSEIKIFQTKYNTINLNVSKDSSEIKFYDSHEKYYELSPFYDVSISFAGILFKSSEQLICFAKAIYSSDTSTAFKILIQTKSYCAHNYAKNIEECSDWNNIYYPILFTANNYKFKNNELKNILINTNENLLVYNSKFDNKLGIGKDGKGQNILGILLMMIRNNLN